MGAFAPDINISDIFKNLFAKTSQAGYFNSCVRRITQHNSDNK
jgi:hypothetical protein